MTELFIGMLAGVVLFQFGFWIGSELGELMGARPS